MTITDAERRRLETFEVSLLDLRRAVGSAIGTGLDGARSGIEQRVGYLHAVLTVMDEFGDLSKEACLDHARIAYQHVRPMARA